MFNPRKLLTQNHDSDNTSLLRERSVFNWEMCLQSATMVEKKLLVNDKITACVNQICLLGVICKIRIEKYCLVKHFAFLNVCYQFSDFSLNLPVFSTSC